MLKKKQQIELLESRIKKLELQLEREREIVKELEAKMAKQKEAFEKEKNQLQQSYSQEVQVAAAAAASRRSSAPPSPSSPRRHPPSPRASVAHKKIPSIDEAVMLPDLPGNFLDLEALAEQKKLIARLEDELLAERKHRREADGEIIRLRANLNGVQLKDSDLEALLAQQLEGPPAKPLNQGMINEEDEETDDDMDVTRFVPFFRRAVALRGLFVSSILCHAHPIPA